MTATIIGWYGTETIGDRAILAGIISLLQKHTDDLEIQLGSLYPFYSQRTITEDLPLLEEFSGKRPVLQLFDSMSSSQLEKAVDNSDLLIMGGGPLMHINALFMVEYAFKRAFKKGVPSLIMGCGVGPIHKGRHRKSLRAIIEKSKRTVLRDQLAVEYLADLGISSAGIEVAPDPAVQCLLDYLDRDYFSEPDESYISLNLRSYPEEYGKDGGQINKRLIAYTQALADQFPDQSIRLTPMHYFHVGGDDREFMNRVRFEADRENLSVQQEPLTLLETMATYRGASLNVGMRFHSVVFQTLLHGDNYVLDYTEPRKGKIRGFLDNVDTNGFYDSRYINLQEGDPASAIPKATGEKFKPDVAALKKQIETYDEVLRSLL
jgi:polysaccharide pyruvyl transferase WcaK-like protein